jgi:hypothetical protein
VRADQAKPFVRFLRRGRCGSAVPTSAKRLESIHLARAFVGYHADTIKCCKRPLNSYSQIPFESQAGYLFYLLVTYPQFSHSVQNDLELNVGAHRRRPKLPSIASKEFRMRRTRIVNVVVQGGKTVLYAVTKRRADLLVADGKAIRKSDLLIELKNKVNCRHAAGIEASALRLVFADSSEGLNETAGETVRFIWSRGPYRFALGRHTKSRRRSK